MILGEKNKKTRPFNSEKNYKQLAVLCILQPLAIFPWLEIYASLPYIAATIISSLLLAGYGVIFVRSLNHSDTRSIPRRIVMVMGGIVGGLIILGGLLHLLSIALVGVPELYVVLSTVATTINETWFMNIYVICLWILLGIGVLVLIAQYFLLQTKLGQNLAARRRTTGASKARRIAGVSLVVIVLLLLTLGGLGSGKLQYGLAYVKCGGAPIAASKFMASYSYVRPGDPGYQPSILDEYFCTEEAAHKKGFHSSVLSDASKDQAARLFAERQEAERFSPEKVDYTLYVPSGKYTFDELRLRTMGGDDLQTFFTIKEDGYSVGSIREGGIPSTYQTCKYAQYICTSIGKDALGREVMKQSAGRDRDIVSYSIDIGSTFIVLTGVYDELTNADIIAIFNSLKEYTDVQ